jgi:DNA polymerase
MSALSELCQEIERCNRCEIAKDRNRAVPGEGANEADIMFIGEAPGWHEDQQGRPFVGPAGNDPLPQEIANCNRWLNRQIELIRPKIIVTLGRYSMALFFPGKSIGRIHGTAEKKDGVIYYAMYHPAAALHQRNLREVIEADMRRIPELLTEVETVPQAASKEPAPHQLNMFEG